MEKTTFRPKERPVVPRNTTIFSLIFQNSEARHYLGHSSDPGYAALVHMSVALAFITLDVLLVMDHFFHSNSYEESHAAVKSMAEDCYGKDWNFHTLSRSMDYVHKV